MKKRLIFLSAVSAVLAMAAGCSLDNGDAFTFVEFGLGCEEVLLPPKDTYENEVLTDSLSRTVQIFTNQSCTVMVKDSGEGGWMHLKDASGKECTTVRGKGDFAFTVAADINEAYARMATLEVATDDGSRRATFLVKQSGKIIPSIALGAASLLLDGDTAVTSVVEMETNLENTDAIQVSVTYPSGSADGWISDVALSAGQVTLQISANPDPDALRFASVRLSYTDGLGTEYGETLYVVQKTATNTLGESVDYATLRAQTRTRRSFEVEDNILLTGYVVSDLASGNVTENVKTASDKTNLDAYKRYLVLEGEDGQYGFLVQTETEADNIYARYDKVSFLLRGATLSYKGDPERFIISGITLSNMVERVTGTAADIPAKRMRIADLTDDDIYTYVTLTDCEFPVRKGALTPFNEGFTNASNKGQANKYPRLVRDKDGNSLYLYTNTTCPYRRNGVQLPYGSGDLSGVVVHEKYQGYIYGDGGSEDEYGTIGRYQIRHMSYDDIAFDADESFSNILVEFNCVPEQRLSDGKYYFDATTGNGRFYHSTGGKINYPLSSFNYIGWVGKTSGIAPFKNHVGCDTSIEQPLGYDFPVDEGWYEDYVNTDGTGKVGRGSNPPWDGWRSQSWWDINADRPYAWIVSFSTEDINAEHLSLQMSTVGGVTGSVGLTPYYWKAQWSETGNMNADADWQDIGEYVVPDGTVSGSYREWQLPACKQIDLPMPLEMLGKEEVYIRLMPTSKITNTLYFNEGVITDGTNSGNTMDYFAVRYH